MGKRGDSQMDTRSTPEPPWRLFRGIKNLVTCKSAFEEQGRRPTESSLSTISDAAILVSPQGVIAWIGREVDWSDAQFETISGSGRDGESHEFGREISSKASKSGREKPKLDEIGLNARLALPAFVECHTHSVFAGNRAQEFDRKWRQGKSYLEIAAGGGGIASTVKATEQATLEELKFSFHRRARRFVEQGVGCLEVKTGYGLNAELERKLLAAMDFPDIDLVRTYLGLHSLPQGKPVRDWIDEVVNKEIPDLVSQKAIDRVDIFLEQGFYSEADAELILDAADMLALTACVHLDQLSHSKALTSLLRHGSLRSLDHLVESKLEDIRSLAASHVVAVLLPTADFYLNLKYPKAREMIENGVRVALATDFNPGSSPTQELSFVGLLARKEMKMSTAEMVVAYTVNAAEALGVSSHFGHLDAGRPAHFITLDCDLDDLFMGVGHHPVAGHYRHGRDLLTEQM